MAKVTNSDRKNDGLTRRRLLQNTSWMFGAVAIGAGSWVFPAKWGHAAGPIKVGIATDLTGPIGIAGNANANVARMVVDDINGAGGVLGRPLELYMEDTASNESIAVNSVRRLVQRDRVDVVLGGITSSMRNAIKDIIRLKRTDLQNPKLTSLSPQVVAAVPMQWHERVVRTLLVS